MNTTRVNRPRRALLLGGGALLLAGLPWAASAQARQRRVIVVGGALGEIVYALDAQSNARGVLVATDTTCTFPAAARALPKVGYQRSLSAEGLLSLRPDLILASSEAGPPNVLTQVKQAGVDVVTFAERHDVDSVRDKISGIAHTLDSDDAGKALQARFDEQWKSATQTVKASALATRAPAPRVLFVLNNSGTQAFVAGQKTAADAMLSYAGVRNAMQGFNGYRPLSAEALISAAPDIVLTTDEALGAIGGVDALLATPGFSATPAGRAKKVASLDTLFMLGFGPRLPAAVVALNQRLAQA
ncbi:iron complex transport system substrate-binding protein [Paraburkholderia sp. GAS199]|uniref:heme/hemin ABC transporter substrate-binding protein n=1 Tax=Paraburkholderia sp. GAS199 TaxID=3035126 RepID=UPI003D1BEB19